MMLSRCIEIADDVWKEKWESILGPETIHIWEPLNLLSFRQSHAIYLNINSVTPNPVAFFIQRCLL